MADNLFQVTFSGGIEQACNSIKKRQSLTQVVSCETFKTLKNSCERLLLVFL